MSYNTGHKGQAKPGPDHHHKPMPKAWAFSTSGPKERGEDHMAQSIIIVGPQGCGKTINAPGLCKAFGVTKWVDADDLRYQRQSMPAEDHIIFAIDWPKDTQGLPCVNFAFAISKVDKPHPMTPKAVEA